jgi:hypothetical protein
LRHEAVAIAAWQLAAQSNANVMIEIHAVVRNITNAANVPVTWLSNFAKRILDWKMLKYK